MPSLASVPAENKPRIQKNAYEVWCEDCTFRRTFPAEPIGTMRHDQNVDRVYALRQAHANQMTGHKVRSSMHCEDIDMGMDLVRLRIGEELLD